MFFYSFSSHSQAINVTNKINGVETSTPSNQGTFSATISNFDLNGGNAVAVLFSAEGTDEFTATYDGQPMVIVSSYKPSRFYSGIAYLINPTSASGDIQISSSHNGVGNRLSTVHSIIAMKNVDVIAGSGSLTKNADLSYTTTQNGGYVLAAAENNNWKGPAPIISGRPSNNLFSGASDGNHAVTHAHGPVNLPSTYSDNYSDILNAVSIIFEAKVDPCDPVASGNTDTDGDGIADLCDLDADNDGILDVDERISGQLSYEFYEGTPTDNSVDNIPTTNPDYSGYFSDFDVTSLSNNLTGDTDTFSVRYKGSIDIASDGTYTFYTTSDDGSKLFIDGKEVVDNDGVHAARERSGNITLSAGVHRIEVLFFENTGQQNLSLSYESSLITKRSIPFSMLSSDLDSDSDAVPNHLDLDSENDGVYDALEAGATDTDIDTNGRLVGEVDSNGVPDIANGGFTPVDTGNDGTPNFLNVDSDGDGCSDANEYYNNPSADGGDNGVFGSGAPVVDADGLVDGAGYDGTDYANVINASISSGCDSYIFETTGNWQTPANWNFNRVPTALDTALVEANASLTASHEIGTLTVNTDFTVSIDTLQTLNIKENLTNKGDFTGDGYLVFDGTAAQQIIGNGAATDSDAGSFTNIRLENSDDLSLTDHAELSQVLDLNKGTFTIAPGKLLTFESSESQTAVLSEVGKGGSAGISGCVVIERYISEKNRAFRYIASSVNTYDTCGKESINANLQEGHQVTDYTSYTGKSKTPGFGTHITGSTTGDNGFDATQTGNPSMFTWNEASSPQRWDAIPNTTNKTETGVNTLDIGDSYALMVRGGRELNLNVNNSVAGQTPTTLRFTGELRTGDIPVQNLASDVGEFSLIANPYQAQVNIKELLASADVTGVKNEMVWIFDPTINTRGGYVTLDLFSSKGNSVPSNSTANNYLQPNQSMFVQNTGADPSLTFKETYKKDSNLEFTNGTFSVDNTASLDITLKRSHNSNFKITDGIRLYFEEGFDNAILDNDAVKFWNSDESLAIHHNDKYLSIERRKYPNPEESVQLNLFNYRNAEYQLELDAQDFEKTAYLKDNYTGKLQKLETNAVTTYSFAANTQIPESVSITRFELKFEQETLGVEDINTKDISVYPNPASEILHIQMPDFSGKNASLQLIDMAGRLIFTESVNVENGRISTRNIENLESGVYLINIEVDDKEYTKKVIIR